MKTLKLILFLGLCVGFLVALSTWGFPQTAPVPIPPTPMTGFYTVFIQGANSGAGNAAPRYVYYGPDLTYAACIADTQNILAQPSGLGSTAWFWKPYITCYSYP